MSDLRKMADLSIIAHGKALLASLGEEELAPLRQHLVRKLETIRRTGPAFDREECLPGLSAVATVLRGPLGETAAVSLPVPTDRFVANEQRLVTTLVERCRALQRRLQERVSWGVRACDGKWSGGA